MCGQLDGKIAIWFLILNDGDDRDEDDNLSDDDDVVITEEQSNLWPTHKAEWDVHQRENIVSATFILPNSQTTLS